MQNNSWARLLAYVTGLVNQRLLLQCEYLIAENRILRSHLSDNLRLSDSERRTLAEIGRRLGRKLLSDVACVAKPETILGWYGRLIARKFDGSKHRSYPGRPRGSPEIEVLIVRMAQENGSWGYGGIAGALANLGHHVSDQTVGNMLRRHGIPTAPKRSQTTNWKDFISAHMAVLGMRFLHRRCYDLAWPRDILRAVLYSSGETPHHACQHRPSPNRGLDHSDGAQCRRRRVRSAAAVSVRAARPGCQMLFRIRR